MRGLLGGSRCSQGLVGGLSSPGNAEGNEHKGKEAKEDQANDERQPEGLVIGAGDAWEKGGRLGIAAVVPGTEGEGEEHRGDALN